MSRELLLMRHAKSAWNTDAPNDFSRPLSKRGKRDAPRVGMWLRLNSLYPDHLVCSPAERAKKTMFRVCKELGIGKSEVNWDKRIYAAGPEELLEVLADQPGDTKRVLMIGHNPGFEQLLFHLWGDETQLPPDLNLMPTATLARLEMPDDWGSLGYGCARLITLKFAADDRLVNPQELSNLGLGMLTFQ